MPSRTCKRFLFTASFENCISLELFWVFTIRF
nr:MAG TPA: hypothetical protein [Caudoviricetes sp.]